MPLLKIRAERDQMSAIERRIADYILENAHFLRDYSSQQLADALGISQSSVVKFSQKLGFKGYPDLKYSIGESIARNGEQGTTSNTEHDDGPHNLLSAELWKSKARAEEETRLINPEGSIDQIVEFIRQAGKIFVLGIGEDSIAARAFAIRLSSLGFMTIHHFDPVLMPTGVLMAVPGDVLVVFSEHGQQAAYCRLARLFGDRGGKVVSVTRHTGNPLRAHAHLPLLVSAHDDRAHVEPLLYQSALQHLLDVVFLVLCEDEQRRRQLDDIQAQVRHLLDN